MIWRSGLCAYFPFDLNYYMNYAMFFCISTSIFLASSVPSIFTLLKVEMEEVAYFYMLKN